MAFGVVGTNVRVDRTIVVTPSLPAHVQVVWIDQVFVIVRFGQDLPFFTASCNGQPNISPTPVCNTPLDLKAGESLTFDVRFIGDFPQSYFGILKGQDETGKLLWSLTSRVQRNSRAGPQMCERAAFPFISAILRQ